MSLPGHPRRFDSLRRLVAAGGAFLVLALAIFAASPAAHTWLHASAAPCSGHSLADVPDAAEDDCAIVLFASGVALPIGPATLPPPVLTPRGVSPITAAEIDLVSPRYLRQPERGPPSDWVS